MPKNKEATPKPDDERAAITVRLEPLPLPPDMAKRLAKIYNRAIQRARETEERKGKP